MTRINRDLNEQQQTRVLILNSGAAWARELKALLERQRFQTFAVSTASDALNLIFSSETPFSLVIVDADESQQVGIDFIEKLSKIPKHQSTPVLLTVSNTVHPAQLAEYGRAGATAYLTRPFEAARAINIIKVLSGLRSR